MESAIAHLSEAALEFCGAAVAASAATVSNGESARMREEFRAMAAGPSAQNAQALLDLTREILGGLLAGGRE